jgi:topoisomerase IA-like protein
LEDGTTLVGFDPITGAPIFVYDTPYGPGLVQTPHQENAAGIIHEPGIPGDACRGGSNPENPPQ